MVEILFGKLEGTSYESRADFMANFGECIADLLIPEVLGTAKFFGKESQHLITQMSISALPGTLVARWGKLPKGMTVDPNIMQPTEEDSWIIDLDLSETSEMPFDPEALIAKARTYAERIYAVFRWMVTNEFLREYGGDV